MNGDRDRRSAGFALLLGELDAKALVLLSAAGDDPERAFFVHPAKLGEALVVVLPGEPPRLGYLTPMERDEAAATGLDLLSPEDLDVARWARDTPQTGAFHANVLAQALQRSGVSPGRIALAGRLPLGLAAEVLERLAGEGWSFVSASDALLRIRKHKTAAELAKIRRVAGVTGAAIRAVAGLLAAAGVRDSALELEGEPLRVARLKAKVARIFAGAGLEQPRGNIVAPGGEGGVPHSSGTPSRILRAGETLVVDLFPRGGLFADCTRTFCVGEPPERVAAAFAAVREALALAHAAARPGAHGWDLQVAVCEAFTAKGYATPLSEPGTLQGYVHGLGHGVGFELHEYPSFKRQAQADGLLAVGDVLTLEPGLYDPAPVDGYGIRLEDLVFLNAEAPEILTPLPTELDPRTWSPA
ncbi:MAG: M24 family metallopeptidase [Thermoanaerobaculia bacterium]